MLIKKASLTAARSKAIITLFALVLFAGTAFPAPVSEMKRVDKADYGLASQWTASKVAKLVFDTSVTPHWFKSGDRFWYAYETPEGKRWYLVDPASGTKKPLFDTARMAAMLTTILLTPYDARHLPIKIIRFVKNDTAFRFEVEVPKDNEVLVEGGFVKAGDLDKRFEDKEKEKEKEQDTEKNKEIEAGKTKEPEAKTKTLGFEYELATGKLTLIKDYEPKPKRPRWAQISPDEETVIFARGHNLFMMDSASYALALKKADDKNIKETQLTTDGEEHYSYARDLRDEEKKELEKLEKDRKDYRAPAIRLVWSRDLHGYEVAVADTASGEITVLIEERLNTYVEYQSLRLIGNGRELVWWSERDGWGHYYLYDGTGKLKGRITSGEFNCQGVVDVDEKTRVLYFLACGREAGEDPYYIHLYRAGLDGSGLKLLSPGNFSHSVSMADSARFFVDNFSRVDTAPKSELRDAAGNLLLELETTDVSGLVNAGFKFPECFTVKADDGLTDLFGVMYKPFNFNPEYKYPVITYVYPGPQTESVSKTFSPRNQNIALAQLGFIVIEVGNRGGSPMRSKWYHNYGYGNLRDYGLADKKRAIEQLAMIHSFIDIDRVGIYGHSGGGFMTAAALLVYPDFFKVGVSSSGNHENNVYNRWWSEKHHGVKETVDKDGKVKFEYSIEKNSELAANLKGHLLLTTGDIDNNVHPANTLRLAAALIKAGKRFDFFVFPGQRHGYGDMNDYWFWIRADYFARHLLGDFSQTVDLIELQREKEKTGGKGNR